MQETGISVLLWCESGKVHWPSRDTFKTGCPGAKYNLIRTSSIMLITSANCDPGYDEVLVGHGKIYDSDTFREVEGSHGSFNQLLCMNNEVVERNFFWNRRSNGVWNSLSHYFTC